VENINNKIIKELKEKIATTKELVDVAYKNNEFLGYWMNCYDSKSFDAMNLFYPNLARAELDFSPSELYNRSYRNTDSYYEKSGSNCFNNIPVKFRDGPLFIGLSHQETYGRNALFIPTTCITGANRGLYQTLKKFTPKSTKTRNYFPESFYTENNYSLVNPMRSEVTHAVVLWESNENGDENIKVHWMHESWVNYSEFISVRDVLQHLWYGVEAYELGVDFY
tara:strand:+ start:379 stop:1047 length:669 start_codon:yes stop_codon:yes gene_type:complete